MGPNNRLFSRILIANRGEIALRIIRACKELGIETVAIYSTEDRNSPHVAVADAAVCIGPAPPGQSYLKADRIIAAAEVANVDAIHPGYGFLAENYNFAEQCRESKIEFIGPSADSMRRLGDKAEAKRLAKKAKVPIIPGNPGTLEDDDQAVQVAETIGYPVIIKAAAGGGGRGMRIALNEVALRTNLRGARGEAEAAFGNGALYLEKYIERPRHVEVQIIGDLHGNVVHLWERDCTLQRRYQKLIEESPSPHVSRETRRKLCECALRLARAAGYYSAGTVEFLVDARQRFYFIEANTRIQVEHPVTEMVTGLDLIKLQIRLASGEELPLRQRDIPQRGWSIECRINAEDPSNGFRPCPGRIDVYRQPGGPGVRVDTIAHAGYTVSPTYDSLIAKLIVHQRTREEAIACMSRALAEYSIGPVKTTIPLLSEILRHSDFLEGKTDTGFLERAF